MPMAECSTVHSAMSILYSDLPQSDPHFANMLVTVYAVHGHLHVSERGAIQIAVLGLARDVVGMAAKLFAEANVVWCLEDLPFGFLADERQFFRMFLNERKVTGGNTFQHFLRALKLQFHEHIALFFRLIDAAAAEQNRTYGQNDRHCSDCLTHGTHSFACSGHWSTHRRDAPGNAALPRAARFVVPLARRRARDGPVRVRRPALVPVV